MVVLFLISISSVINMEEEDIFLYTEMQEKKMVKITFMLIFLLCLNAYYLTSIIKDRALKLNFLNITVTGFNGLQITSSQ